MKPGASTLDDACSLAGSRGSRRCRPPSLAAAPGFRPGSRAVGSRSICLQAGIPWTSLRLWPAGGPLLGGVATLACRRMRTGLRWSYGLQERKGGGSNSQGPWSLAGFRSRCRRRLSASPSRSRARQHWMPVPVWPVSQRAGEALLDAADPLACAGGRRETRSPAGSPAHPVSSGGPEPPGFIVHEAPCSAVWSPELPLRGQRRG